MLKLRRNGVVAIFLGEECRPSGKKFKQWPRRVSLSVQAFQSCVGVTSEPQPSARLGPWWTQFYRIVMDDNIVVGAVLIGSQGLADPLLRLIKEEANISRYKPELLGGGEDLPEVILRAWRNWR